MLLSEFGALIFRPGDLFRGRSRRRLWMVLRDPSQVLSIKTTNLWSLAASTSPATRNQRQCLDHDLTISSVDGVSRRTTFFEFHKRLFITMAWLWIECHCCCFLQCWCYWLVICGVGVGWWIVRYQFYWKCAALFDHSQLLKSHNRTPKMLLLYYCVHCPVTWLAAL